MIPPAFAAFAAFAERGLVSLHTRAAQRQVEQDEGQAETATGRYWLARTSALEHVADASRRGDRVAIQRALDNLDRIELTQPMSRDGDHAGKAAA